MPPPSFWSRLFGGQATAPTSAPAPAPAAAPVPPAAKPSSAHKQVRAERREQLFALVRENMIRAGVLSNAYKFKVLTLDSIGQNFIVMIDVQSGSMNHDAATLARLEASLQTLSQERLGIGVKNVYWRVLEDVGNPDSVNMAATQQAAAPRPTPARHPLDTITADELLASRAGGQRVGPASDVLPRSPLPDFAPTQPMDAHPGNSDFGPLSETQPGRLD